MIYHPVVLFVYIASILVISMITMNPVYIGLSVLLGIIYGTYLVGFKTMKQTLTYSLLIFVAIVIFNPLFNHHGEIIMFTLFNNPITLEALCYGIVSGGMLVAVLVWFVTFNALITNDKFIFLFGRILPTVAFMLSMIFRLIPLTQHKTRTITNAQQVMGLGMDTGTKKEKIQRGVRISSILMGWVMEDALETADSMKAKGYGTGKRTFFNNYKWQTHDIISLFIILLMIACNIIAIVLAPAFEFYPTFSGGLTSTYQIIGYLLFILLAVYPLMLELKETITWKLST
jgi:energy-coupling factor transport system permease protein